jgi:hypothetical protein
MKGYTALLLDAAARDHVLTCVPSRFPNVVCHHITLEFGVEDSAPLPNPISVAVVGYATDDLGVEALVVEVDGITARPSGGTYHITLSLGEGRKPKESNDIITSKGWTPLDTPINIAVVPQFIPFAR